MSDPGEDDLIARAIAGNRPAVERLLLDYYTPLARHLTPLIPISLQSVVSVEDILQETFSQAFQEIHTFTPLSDKSFGTWLKAIAENRLRDWVKALKRKKRGGEHRQLQPVSRPDEDSVANLAEMLSAGHSNLASAGNDEITYVWDAHTGRLLHTLAGHSAAVFDIAFSPDGRRLASAGRDRTVKLWHVVRARQLFTCRGHDHTLLAVAFSPDGRWLASGSFDCTAKSWDASNGKLVRTMAGHTGADRDVAVNPDGRRLATVSNDRTIKLWNTASGRELLTLAGHANWATKSCSAPQANSWRPPAMMQAFDYGTDVRCPRRVQLTWMRVRTSIGQHAMVTKGGSNERDDIEI